MSRIEIAVLVLIILALLLFLGCVFILWKNHSYRVKYDFLKKKYNKLVQYDFEKMMIPIDHISYYHQKFEGFSEFFSMFIESYNDELADIKDNIYKMSEVLKAYDWINFNRMHNVIKERLANVDDAINEIIHIYNDILEYKSYISWIAISYRENVHSLIDFYEKNLVIIPHDSKTIQSLIFKLKEYTIELNGYIENQNFYKIIKTLKDFNVVYEQSFNIILNLYLYSKQYTYINYNFSEIKKVLDKSTNNYKNSDVANKMAKIEYNRDNINKKLSKNGFEKIGQIFNDTIKLVVNVKQQLQLNFKSNEFMTENKDVIFKHIQQFVNLVKDIHTLLNKISVNFHSDQNVRETTKKLKNKVNILKNECLILLNDDFKKNKISCSDLYLKLKDLINEIIIWSNEFNEIVVEIKNKYDYFKEIVNEITASKILLAQMTIFINSKNSKDSSLVAHLKPIKKHFNELNEIEKNFLYNHEKNFNKNHNELLKIKYSIDELHLVIASVYLTKKYVEKLIKYANILVINEGAEINFDEIIESYEKLNYSDALTLLINQLKPYKYNNYRKELYGKNLKI